MGVIEVEGVGEGGIEEGSNVWRIVGAFSEYCTSVRLTGWR